MVSALILAVHLQTPGSKLENYVTIWRGHKRDLRVARILPVTNTRGIELTHILSEFAPGGNKPLRSVFVGHFEGHHCSIVGDGDRSPLLLEFDQVGVGVESFFYEIVDKSFKLSPLFMGKCWGINEPYVLSSLDHGYPAGRNRYHDLKCQTVSGKHTYWRIQFRPEEFLGAEWSGGRVLVKKKSGVVVLNPMTGKRI